MPFYWYTILALFIVFFVLRKDLRKEMIWSGLFLLPVFLIKAIISENFFGLISRNSALYFIERSIIGFSFGAVAAVIYEIFFHKKITPEKHPHRKKMIYLFLGPLCFLTLFILRQNIFYSLVISLFLDLTVLLIIRHDLVWDMIFSGVAMGTLYLAIYIFSFFSFPGDLKSAWFMTNIPSLTFLGLPLEEIIVVLLFGALWGPLYVAAKDFNER